MLIDVARRWTPLAPGGAFSLTDVRDVAAGIACAMENGQVGRNYILAGHNMSYADGWELFARVCGGKGAVWRMRAFAHFVAGLGGDLWGGLTGNEPVINSASMGLARQHHIFSSSRAASELGYKIRPAEETVKDTWQWFKHYGYVKLASSDDGVPSTATGFSFKQRAQVGPAETRMMKNGKNT